MDTVGKTIQETPMPQAYKMLAATVDAIQPDRLSEEVVASLRFMLTCETFAPIRDTIANKLIEIGEYFARRDEMYIRTNLEGKPINKPKRTPDSRKKKKKTSNAGDIPDGSTPVPSLVFQVDEKTGLIIPIKK